MVRPGYYQGTSPYDGGGSADYGQDPRYQGDPAGYDQDNRYQGVPADYGQDHHQGDRDDSGPDGQRPGDDGPRTPHRHNKRGQADKPRRPRLLRRLLSHRSVQVVLVALIIFLGWVGWSVGQALMAPGNGTVSSTSRMNIRLRKGAIARVDCTRRPGVLNWLVDPRILRGVYTNVTKRSLRKTSLK